MSVAIIVKEKRTAQEWKNIIVSVLLAVFTCLAMLTYVRHNLPEIYKIGINIFIYGFGAIVFIIILSWSYKRFIHP